MSHADASSRFLDDWNGADTLTAEAVVTGTKDGTAAASSSAAAEAEAEEQKEEEEEEEKETDENEHHFQDNDSHTSDWEAAAPTRPCSHYRSAHYRSDDYDTTINTDIHNTDHTAVTQQRRGTRVRVARPPGGQLLLLTVPADLDSAHVAKKQKKTRKRPRTEQPHALFSLPPLVAAAAAAAAAEGFVEHPMHNVRRPSVHRAKKVRRACKAEGEGESRGTSHEGVISVWFPSETTSGAHKIRVINRDGRTYVHAADLAGVVERKSNISRLVGQFTSPDEKVLLKVVGGHNFLIGQESNALTHQGVLRFLATKKMKDEHKYRAWITKDLLPHLTPRAPQAASRTSTHAAAGNALS